MSSKVRAASRPVYIRRIAHVSALGLSAGAAARAFLAGECVAGWRDSPDVRYPWFGLPLPETEWSTRLRRTMAALRAELDADLSGLPLFLGSSSLQVGALEAMARATGKVVLSANPADIGAEIAALLGNRTDAWMFSTGCSSGLAALEAAFLMIAQGRIDRALVLGFEFANETTLAGFASLGLLAPDKDADGLILGEAVGALLLSADPGDGPVWRIAACRLGIDAHSPTAPTPDGSIIAANLAAVLEDAQVAAAEIDLVKSHQGRIPATDAAEAAALARVFGSHHPPEITCKRQIGHTLGASGPAELTLLLALLATPDGIERYGRPKHLLFNLVGFGGSIAAVVLSENNAARGAGGLPPAPTSLVGDDDNHPAPITQLPPVIYSMSSRELAARVRQASSVPLRRAGLLARTLIAGAGCLVGEPARK
ncbi:MAG: hypothetical protein LBD68_00275, partial [Zoogloeaceae bacterium]|nr:hypothetical protein [Zoogloeaceae bacterium]